MGSLTLPVSTDPYIIVPLGAVPNTEYKNYTLSLLTKQRQFGRLEQRQPTMDLISKATSLACLACGQCRRIEPSLQCCLYELVYSRWWCLVGVNNGDTLWNLIIQFDQSKNCQLSWRNPHSSTTGPMVVQSKIAPHSVQHVAIVVANTKNNKPRKH